MKSLNLIAVWVYMLLTVGLEVLFVSYYQSASIPAVSVIATSQAVAIVLFYMHLKYEPNSIRLFAIVSIMFLAALLAAMIATLG